MLTADRAWSRIEDRLAPLPPERLPWTEAAGRVLAAPCAATMDMPQGDVSAMDGYVSAGPVKAGDVRTVVGIASAGCPPAFSLDPGQVAKIMTGAVVPDGGDRVVPIEQTDGGREHVRFTADAEFGAHIRLRGEVVRRGAPLLGAGTVLTPGAVSSLAAHGHVEIPVFGAPRVATLATGDEVVPPDQTPGPGQLRDSNSAFLRSALAGLGLRPKALGIASDRAGVLADRVGRGLEHEVFLLTGGVSMGDYDLVEDVLAEAGCETLVDAVAIQPGKPLVVARHQGGWVFGLPGNPASVMVTFWLFVRPLLRRLMGHDDAYGRGRLRATLGTPAPGAKGRDRYLAAEVAVRDGILVASPVVPRGSHDVGAYGVGSALLRIPAHSPPAEAGAECEIVSLVDWP